MTIDDSNATRFFWKLALAKINRWGATRQNDIRGALRYIYMRVSLVCGYGINSVQGERCGFPMISRGGVTCPTVKKVHDMGMIVTKGDSVGFL